LLLDHLHRGFHLEDPPRAALVQASDQAAYLELPPRQSRKYAFRTVASGAKRHG
jgi:hypothetical protein